MPLFMIALTGEIALSYIRPPIYAAAISEVRAMYGASLGDKVICE